MPLVESLPRLKSRPESIPSTLALADFDAVYPTALSAVASGVVRGDACNFDGAIVAVDQPPKHAWWRELLPSSALGGSRIPYINLGSASRGLSSHGQRNSGQHCSGLGQSPSQSSGVTLSGGGSKMSQTSTASTHLKWARSISAAQAAWLVDQQTLRRRPQMSKQQGGDPSAGFIPYTSSRPGTCASSSSRPGTSQRPGTSSPPDLRSGSTPPPDRHWIRVLRQKEMLIDPLPGEWQDRKSRRLKKEHGLQRLRVAQRKWVQDQEHKREAKQARLARKNDKQARRNNAGGNEVGGVDGAVVDEMSADEDDRRGKKLQQKRVVIDRQDSDGVHSSEDGSADDAVGLERSQTHVPGRHDIDKDDEDDDDGGMLARSDTHDPGDPMYTPTVKQDDDLKLTPKASFKRAASLTPRACDTLSTASMYYRRSSSSPHRGLTDNDVGLKDIEYRDAQANGDGDDTKSGDGAEVSDGSRIVSNEASRSEPKPAAKVWVVAASEKIRMNFQKTLQTKSWEEWRGEYPLSTLNVLLTFYESMKRTQGSNYRTALLSRFVDVLSVALNLKNALLAEVVAVEATLHGCFRRLPKLSSQAPRQPKRRASLSAPTTGQVSEDGQEPPSSSWIRSVSGPEDNGVSAEEDIVAEDSTVAALPDSTTNETEEVDSVVVSSAKTLLEMFRSIDRRLQREHIEVFWRSEALRQIEEVYSRYANNSNRILTAQLFEVLGKLGDGLVDVKTPEAQRWIADVTRRLIEERPQEKVDLNSSSSGTPRVSAAERREYLRTLSLQELIRIVTIGMRERQCIKLWTEYEREIKARCELKFTMLETEDLRELYYQFMSVPPPPQQKQGAQLRGDDLVHTRQRNAVLRLVEMLKTCNVRGLLGSEMTALQKIIEEKPPRESHEEAGCNGDVSFDVFLHWVREIFDHRIAGMEIDEYADVTTRELKQQLVGRTGFTVAMLRDTIPSQLRAVGAVVRASVQAGNVLKKFKQQEEAQPQVAALQSDAGGSKQEKKRTTKVAAAMNAFSHMKSSKENATIGEAPDAVNMYGRHASERPDNTSSSMNKAKLGKAGLRRANTMLQKGDVKGRTGTGKEGDEDPTSPTGFQLSGSPASSAG